MSQQYEYEFVRMTLREYNVDEYQEIVQRYAKDGWRLVQVFAPPVILRMNRYFDLIFEREASA